MNKKCIYVKDENDNTEIYYYKKIDVAKKYNLSSQHISNILKGVTKHKFFIYNEKIIHLEYKECEEEQLKLLEKIRSERRKETNKRAYEKIKKMRQKN